MTGEVLFLVHLSVTLFLCGLIWVVQVVHYPLFDRVDPKQWSGFALAHRNRISLVVAPTMVLEGITAVALVAMGPIDPVPAWSNLALLAGIWASTAFLQVPAHGQLEHRFRAEPHRRLVRSNWIRTALWTMRAVGLVVLAVRSPMASG